MPIHSFLPVVGTLLMGILMFLPAVRAGEPAPVMAVFEIENCGTSLTPDDLRGLSEYFSNKMGENGDYQIVPREDIRKRLQDQKQQSFKSCFDQNCQIEIGRELAAQYTVHASISKVGSQCLITAAIYDLKRAATSRTATARGACNADELIGHVEEVAKVLKGKGSFQETKPQPQPEPVAVQPPPPVAQQPVAPPAPAPAASQAAPSMGWAVASSVIGFISAGIVLGLSIGAGLTTDQWTAVGLGGADLVLLGVMGPVVQTGGSSARSGTPVWGSLGLRITGWVFYGLTLATGVVMVVMGAAAAEVPPPLIYTTGCLGLLTLVFFSIDNLISRSQALEWYEHPETAAMEDTGFRWMPVLSPVVEPVGGGITGATLGLAGRF